MCSESFFETCARCPDDCGECQEVACECGDGTCDNYYCAEDCGSCSADCGECVMCGDGRCSSGTATAPNCGELDAMCEAGDSLACTAAILACAPVGYDERSTCAQDCGDACGDGVCQMPETWTTCPQDCDTSGSCGDGVCFGSSIGSEDFNTCPADCKAASECGDGVCVGTVAGVEVCDVLDVIAETAATCPEDCDHPGTGGCGDGLCTETAGENCGRCPADCGSCIDIGCGDGICQSEAATICNGVSPADGNPCTSDAQCQPMQPYCDPDVQKCRAYKAFGGETCSTCATDCGTCPVFSCGDSECTNIIGEHCGNCAGDCGACKTESCGDGLCGTAEDCSSCSEDCGPCSTCGDDVCAGAPGEDWQNCAQDCGGGPQDDKYRCGDGRCDPGEDWTCADCSSVASTCSDACSDTGDCPAPWTACGSDIGGTSARCIPVDCAACFDNDNSCSWATDDNCSGVSCTDPDASSASGTGGSGGASGSGGSSGGGCANGQPSCNGVCCGSSDYNCCGHEADCCPSGLPFAYDGYCYATEDAYCNQKCANYPPDQICNCVVNIHDCR